MFSGPECGAWRRGQRREKGEKQRGRAIASKMEYPQALLFI